MSFLRKCRKCSLEAKCEEDLTLFAYSPSCKHNRDSICNDCKREVGRKYSKENPTSKEQMRKKLLKRFYNMTLEDYSLLLNKQDNKCAICAIHIEEYGKDSFVVDHCHSSGKVRGLLCQQCNTGLGMFKDNPNSLQTAIEYLKGYSND